jgi:hypothetical protein
MAEVIMLVYVYAYKNLTVVRQSEQGIEGVRIYKMLIAKQKVNIVFSNDSGTISTSCVDK